MNELGREFIRLFDHWAKDYDQTVQGYDPEYKAVFLDYDMILRAIVDQVQGNVLEFGVGTGNLTAKIYAANHRIFGVEPSKEMRKQAKLKVPQVTIYDGDFLKYPKFDCQIDTIVSSYAFHHLTDTEKSQAILAYSRILPLGGRIIFADTAFATKKAREEAIRKAEKMQYFNLAEDLKTEYYPLLHELEQAFTQAGFKIEFKRLNDFVWLMAAEKVREVEVID